MLSCARLPTSFLSRVGFWQSHWLLQCPARFLCLTRSSWADRNGAEDGQSKEIKVEIPVERLNIKFARSSGPGGQNVNKVNTKVDVRFHVPSADWLPERVRAKLMEKEKNRVNKNQELIISSTKFRTQHRNLEDALQRLQTMIARASFVPQGPTTEQQAHVRKLVRAANERRLKDKKIHSIKKRDRQAGPD